MTYDVQQRRAQNGVSYTDRSHKRAPDAFERLLMLIVAGGMVASLLLMVAVTLGAVWMIVIIVSDLARRLGL
jgi:hypothetical protein